MKNLVLPHICGTVLCVVNDVWQQCEVELYILLFVGILCICRIFTRKILPTALKENVFLGRFKKQFSMDALHLEMVFNGKENSLQIRIA